MAAFTGRRGGCQGTCRSGYPRGRRTTMDMRLGRWLVLVALAGCSPSSVNPPSILAVSCRDDLAGFFTTTPSDLPAFDPSHRGDVVRCATERAVTADQLTKTAKALGYVGP